MTTRRVTPLTVGRSSAYPWENTVLPVVSARYVPMVLASLESRKLAFAWETPADYELGYDSICRLQEALLMDAADRIVSEVRALRAGQVTPVEARDPQLDPYTLDLPSLGNLNTSLLDLTTEQQVSNDAIVGELQAIRALLEAEAGGDLTEVLGKLDILIALL